MRTSFGMDTATRATDWTSVKAGPDLATVRRHLVKLTTFHASPRR